jgi:D-alanyl-D-alanine carboxypeptidase (penicillin-binding protein 5/6)
VSALHRAVVALCAVVVALAVAARPAVAASTATTSSAPACPASVTAPEAIVIEVSSGQAACARHADQERPIASTTKLMTALVTIEHARLAERFRTSPYRPAPAESVIGLLPGERMTVRDLLHGLLVYSGNDAAMALAYGVSGSERRFVALMNRRARELGLTETHYENPIGLDAPGNYSSARDLVTLARVVRTNPFLRATVDLKQVTLASGFRPRHFLNRNTILREFPWANGVKTGHTRDAGYVLVGSARKHGVQVISAVLDTPSEASRDAQSVALLRDGLHAFRTVRAARAGKTVPGLKPVPIRYRPGAGLKLVVGHNHVRAIVPRGDRRIVTVRATKVPAQVTGPIRRGQVLGRADVLRGKVVIGTVPLVAAQAVPAASFGQRTKAWFTRPGAVVLVFAVLGGTVLFARRRSVRSRRRPRREASAA